MAALCAVPRARPFVLAAASVWHVGADVSNYAVSVALHVLWCFRPLSCLWYFACVHTPLHYYRVRQHAPLLVFLCCSAVLFVFVERLKEVLDDALGALWWVAPVAAHASLV